MDDHLNEWPMKFYVAAYFPVSRILENLFQKIVQKTQDHLKFHRAKQNSACFPNYFPKILEDVNYIAQISHGIIVNPKLWFES